jgi:uncharacterized membrane protein YgdD (TMEM256/DUF423 family)
LTASRIHLFLASLMGGGGIALWAMAAHRPGAVSLVTAAHFMLFHASAIIRITACRKHELLHNRTASLAVTALILGTVFFSGDLMMRSFAQVTLFASAAPIGGSLTILGWLLLTVAAALRNNQS